MNFLFEIQKKKNKSQVPVRKQVSMDIRIPERHAPGTFSYSFGPVPKPQKPLPRSFVYPRSESRQAGVSYKANPSLQYSEPARREYAALKNRRGFRHQLLSAAEDSFDALWGSFQRIHISFPRFTPNKLVYGSIMSGVAFGMVSLGVIEKTFESNAAAEDQATAPRVESVKLETGNYNPEKDVFTQYFSDAADAEYQAGVRNLVKGYPIEEMLPYIFEKDRVTAAFLIGIAKKESNWGKRRPVLDGQDCFNYWGYRGQRRLMGSGGHTCFNSRKDAVDTVAKRLENLINSERLDTPAKLIVWKCGFSCEGHGRESVEKWISDVDAYYSEMMALEGENGEFEDEE
jgi:hypothetical protein